MGKVRIRNRVAVICVKRKNPLVQHHKRTESTGCSQWQVNYGEAEYARRNWREAGLNLWETCFSSLSPFPGWYHMW